ncbi:MAG: hypothetical protein WD049_03320 [Candidatus Paceibacterota bacterium]
MNSVIDAVIDVKPGSDPNSISLKSKGVLPIGIFSTQVANGEAEDFDATTTDTSTIELNGVRIDPRHAAFEDIDGDGDDDLILHFDMPELVDEGVLDENSVDLLLTAEFDGGVALGPDLVGSDAVRIVPPKGRGNN